MPKRIEILGVPLDCVTMESAIHYADQLIRERKSAAILAVNPEKVIKCLDNPEFHKLINNAGLLIPDGIGVVLAARMLGERGIKRVPGAELMPGLCELAEREGYTIFLFGATPEVNEQACEVIRSTYPGIKLVGQQHGYLAHEDMEGFIDRLKQLSPDILFVALGSPKQEQWIMQYLPELNISVCQGVGGTFDVLSGNVRRAPWIFRSMNLEWLYRLLASPKRLIRQTALPRFTWKFLVYLIGRRSITTG